MVGEGASVRRDGRGWYCRYCGKGPYLRASQVRGHRRYCHVAIADTKQCSRCSRVLPLSGFYQQKHRGSKGGVRSQAWCRDCMKERAKHQPRPPRQKILEYARRFREQNRDSIRAYARARRTATTEGVTKIEVLGLYEAYSRTCLCCGAKRPLTSDHVVPLARGGQHSIDNLQPLCQTCNPAKQANIIDFRKGAAALAATLAFAPLRRCLHGELP